MNVRGGVCVCVCVRVGGCVCMRVGRTCVNNEALA